MARDRAESKASEMVKSWATLKRDESWGPRIILTPGRVRLEPDVPAQLLRDCGYGGGAMNHAKLAEDAIELMIEYRDAYDHPEDDAKYLAIAEVAEAYSGSTEQALEESRMAAGGRGRLIAAASDLLEMLEIVEPTVEKYDSPVTHDHVMQALRKARGERR